MNEKRATMKDVAKRAGVTQPTVSYVMNGTANISDEVKERVRRAIKELNYKPNYCAVALKTNKTNLVGIIIPDIVNEYYASMVNMVENLLSKEKYTVIINSTNYDEQLEEKCIRQQITYNVEGIIVMYQLKSEKGLKILRDSGKRTVMIEGGKAYPHIPCINTDNFYGGYTATNYLLEQGRKRIVYVEQRSRLEALEERRRGYTYAMEEKHISWEGLIYYTKGPGNKWEEGIIIGQKLIDRDMDGIVVSSDIVAVGIIKTLLMAGKRVPQDVAVVGYDDVPLARLFIPALTTVAQPVEEMCKLAVQYMLGQQDMLEHKVLRARLIVRETA